MLEQQGTVITLQQYRQSLEEKNFSYCTKHEAYFLQNCSFCFPQQQVQAFIGKVKTEPIYNYVIFDIQEKYDKQLYNAGISSYQQTQFQDQIEQLRQQGKQPHEIAIELQCYTMENVHNLIKNQIQQQGNQQTNITIDFWTISNTQSYIELVQEAIQKLNLLNSIILFPGQKGQILTIQNLNGWTTSETINEDHLNKLIDKLTLEKKIVNKKTKLTNVENGQSIRIMGTASQNCEQQTPFSGDILYFTNQKQEKVIQRVQTFSSRKGKIHVACQEQDKSYYFNLTKITNGQISSIENINFEKTKFQIRMIISDSFIFTESNNQIYETELSNLSESFFVNIKIANKNEQKQVEQIPVVQIIIQEDMSNVLVEQIIIENILEQQQNLSQKSLHLTDYSKE